MFLWEILFNRWFVLILGIFFMLVGLMPEWTMRAVRMVGKMGWAESRVGMGGTFTIWKIIGIIAPLLAILYFFSWHKNVDFYKTPAPAAPASVEREFGF